MRAADYAPYLAVAAASIWLCHEALRPATGASGVSFSREALRRLDILSGAAPTPPPSPLPPPLSTPLHLLPTRRIVRRAQPPPLPTDYLHPLPTPTPLPTPLHPLLAARRMASRQSCEGRVDTEERRAAAQQTLAQLASWQSRGGACVGTGRNCLPLQSVVPPSAQHERRGSNGQAFAAGCAASRLCDGRGRPPRVYVYGCLDGPHAALVGTGHVGPFFDANAQRNQYLSEYALHRSLLQYAHRVRRAEEADFFFVPFYARLAYADKRASKRTRRMQKNLTSALASCLRSSRWWQRARGRDHFTLISSTRNPTKLFGDAWPLLKHATILKIEAADERYTATRSAAALSRRAARRRKRTPGRQLGDGGGVGVAHAAGEGEGIVIPYYVPHFAGDDWVAPALKRHSVCFFGSATNGVRRRAVAELARVPDAVMALSAMEHFNRSVDARLMERRRTLQTRHRMRKCKLCLVPAGLTPSSRRFYEAIVAKCVPLLLADRFVPAFTHLFPLQSYAVRAPQSAPDALPLLVNQALQRWPQLYHGLEAARSAFIYGLGLPPPEHGGPMCDATQAVLAELQLRFALRSAHKSSRSACLGESEGAASEAEC